MVLVKPRPPPKNTHSQWLPGSEEDLAEELERMAEEEEDTTTTTNNNSSARFYTQRGGQQQQQQQHVLRGGGSGAPHYKPSAPVASQGVSVMDGVEETAEEEEEEEEVGAREKEKEALPKGPSVSSRLLASAQAARRVADAFQ